MTTNKKLLIAVVALFGCVAALWLSTSIQASYKTYEVRPEITIPEYRTDAARAIDAYERLMERFMNMTERDLNTMSGELKTISQKLSSIDTKLTGLSKKVARIERSLGIKQPKKPIVKTPKPETPDNTENQVPANLQ